MFVKILRYGSTGIDVELLQSTLKKIGFYNGKIDGIFGNHTQDAVYNFQREFGIKADGVVGEQTWNKLMPYINGTVGNIVPTDMSYPYRIMMMNINSLKNKYPFIVVGNYGESVLERKIPYIKLGVGEKQVFYSASMHANEWINSVVMMKFVEEYAIAYENDGKLFDRSIREMYNDASIYIAPMVNPDGVDLVAGDLDMNLIAYRNAKTIGNNFPNIPFPSGWKANILRGRYKFTVPGKLDISKRKQICSRLCKACPKRFCRIRTTY